MTDSTQPASNDIDALLEELLVDAYGDDEQLTAIHEGMESGIELPIDVLVAGEPMALVAINYDGNSRRGLVAQCKRVDGSKHCISLGDVQIRSHTEAYRYICVYCRWLGIEPMAMLASLNATRQSDELAADEVNIDLTAPVELIVVVVKQRAARCRQLANHKVITLKAPTSYLTVPGQIVTVEPNKFWYFNGHPYLSGDIVSTRIDVEMLGLPSLTISEVGVWDPQVASNVFDLVLTDEDDSNASEPNGNLFKAVIARGPRPVFEMQQITPGHDLEDNDAIEIDPIIGANELRVQGDYDAARQILADLLVADFRCLDAHAHLGNMTFESFPKQALDHYSVGVEIGLQALGSHFTGVLPWSRIGNRPFLRCLLGYSLCLWKLERWQQAGLLFERILDLSPLDELGVRDMLPMVKAKLPYDGSRV